MVPVGVYFKLTEVDWCTETRLNRIRRTTFVQHNLVWVCRMGMVWIFEMAMAYQQSN